MSEEERAERIKETNATDGEENERSEPGPPTFAQLVAEVIRDRSKSRAVLTRVDALRVDGAAMDLAQQEELIADIQEDESLKDIELLRGADGVPYLYSSSFISDTYARILLRAEEGNPYETIAATVREESELYPRPTPLETLKQPAFGLDVDRLEQLIEEMKLLEGYQDIKVLKATTGAIYMYCDKFLDRDWAESLMEWEEVGKHKSL